MAKHQLNPETIITLIKKRDTKALLKIDESRIEPEVLGMRYGKKGTSIVRLMIKLGYKFRSYEKLRAVVSKLGITVAHLMAEAGHVFDPEKELGVLLLKDNHGFTVAHQMARQGYFFDPDRYRDIIMLADSSGNTVAHEMADAGHFFDPEKHRDILLLKNRADKTVAHIMALRGYRFDPDKHRDILKLSDKYGQSVAHEMAIYGYVFDPVKHKEICNLKDEAGNSVLGLFLWLHRDDIIKGKHDQNFLNLPLESLEAYLKKSKPMKDKILYDYLRDIYRAKLLQEKAFEEIHSVNLNL